MSVAWPIAVVIAVLTVLLVPAVRFVFSGLRGVRVPATPRCRQCHYDPRGNGSGPADRCAVCRADLTRPGAITLHDRVRFPGRVLAGAGLFTLAVVLSAAAVAVVRSIEERARTSVVMTPRMAAAVASRGAFPSPVQFPPADYPKASTGDLIALLFRRGDDAKLWDELQARCVARRIGPNEVTRAFGGLCAFAEYRFRPPADVRTGHTPSTTRPTTLPTAAPLAFVAAARANGLLDPRSLILLARGFSDPAQAAWPTIVRRGRPFPLAVRYTTVPLPPCEPVFAVQQVMIDPGMFRGRVAPGPATVTWRATPTVGRPTPTLADASASALTGGQVDLEIVITAAPGPHVLVLILDAAVLPDTAPPRPPGPPGQASSWPTTPAKWYVSVPVWVNVVAAPATAPTPP